MHSPWFPYGVRPPAAGEAAGGAALGARPACAAPPGRVKLGEATGGAVAAGSRVGRAIRGSGVDSGIVSATPGVAVAAGDPPTVTTTNGWLGSTVWGCEEDDATAASRMPQPVLASNRRAARSVSPGAKGARAASTSVLPAIPSIASPRGQSRLLLSTSGRRPGGRMYFAPDRRNGLLSPDCSLTMCGVAGRLNLDYNRPIPA